MKRRLTFLLFVSAVFIVHSLFTGLLFAIEPVMVDVEDSPPGLSIPSCPSRWAGDLNRPTLRKVQSIAAFDDGSGPAVFLGGAFTNAWNVLSRSIVKWDGEKFSELPELLGPYTPTIDVIPTVRALAVFDDGSGAALIVAGCFGMLGETQVNSILKWDGVSWSELGSGIDYGDSCKVFSWSPKVNALMTFDDGGGNRLYAGGDFHHVGGLPADNIAQWDGSNWSAVGGGVDGIINAMAVFDDGSGPALYCGGSFQFAGGVPASGIAKWDGASWSGVASGITGTPGVVYSLRVFADQSGPALFVGGDFSTAGSSPASNIARWDGTSWLPLAGGVTGTGGVRAMAVFDQGGGSALVVGGHFTHANAVQVDRIALWDGQTWSPMGGVQVRPEAGTSSVLTMESVESTNGPRILVAGNFDSVDGVIAFGAAQWDGVNWAPLNGPASHGVDNTVFDMTFEHDGSGPALYMGGRFIYGGSQVLNRIGRFDGTNWSPLGAGMNNQVNGLTFYDDGSGRALYAVGGFTTAGGVPANRVAKWDGANWSALGNGLGRSSETIMDIVAVESGPAQGLYAGGAILGGVFRWNGSSWQYPAHGTNGTVSTLTVFDDGSGPCLYAGGSFTRTGETPALHVAKWNGISWSPLGGGLTESVEVLKVIDLGTGPTLYAAGGHSISRWDGATWNLVGSSGTGPGFASVSALEAFDDGTGQALYVGGYFSNIDGTPARHFAKWTEGTWMGINSSIDGIVYDLAVFQQKEGTRLYLGGDARMIADVAPTTGLAAWLRPLSCNTQPIPALSSRASAVMVVLVLAAGVLVLKAPRRKSISSSSGQ